MAQKCLICSHPLREYIDQLLKEKDNLKSQGEEVSTDEEILVKVDVKMAEQGLDPAAYPTIKDYHVSRHRKNHSYDPLNIGALLIVDGKLFRPDGTEVKAIPLRDTLKAIVTMALNNAFDQKGKNVTIRDGLAAAKLLTEIDKNAIEQDEYDQEWSTFTKRKAAERAALARESRKRVDTALNITPPDEMDFIDDLYDEDDGTHEEEETEVDDA